METTKYRIETGRGEGGGVGDEVVTDMMGQPAQQGSFNALIALCPLGLSFPTHHLVAPSRCPRSLASLIRKWERITCKERHGLHPRPLSIPLADIIFPRTCRPFIACEEKKREKKEISVGTAGSFACCFPIQAAGAIWRRPLTFRVQNPPQMMKLLVRSPHWIRGTAQYCCNLRSNPQPGKPRSRPTGIRVEVRRRTWHRGADVRTFSPVPVIVRVSNESVQLSKSLPQETKANKGPVNRRETGLARIISCAFTSASRIDQARLSSLHHMQRAPQRKDFRIQTSSWSARHPPFLAVQVRPERSP